MEKAPAAAAVWCDEHLMHCMRRWILLGAASLMRITTVGAVLTLDVSASVIIDIVKCSES